MSMKYIGLVAAAALFASCSLGVAPDVGGPDEDIARFDAIFGSSANSSVAANGALVALSNSVSAQTTYNYDASAVAVTVAAGTTQTLPDRANYPYPNWTTSGTVEDIPDISAHATSKGWNSGAGSAVADLIASGNNLFLVTAIARPTVANVYPESEVKEVYYVTSTDDVFDAGLAGGTDPIFDPIGDQGSGYREEYTTTYTDDSVRTGYIEVIGETTAADRLAAFAIGDSLKYEDFSSSLPWNQKDSSAGYSSSVVYSHDLGQTYNFWFWNNSDPITPQITGTRYYTEHENADGSINGTSITVEYVLNTDPNRDTSVTPVLARTIIREETVFESAGGNATSHTLRTETAINNTSGGASLLYTRNGTQISSIRFFASILQPLAIFSLQRSVLPSNVGQYATTVNAVLADLDI